MKHTPGPWKNVLTSSGEHWIAIAARSTGYTGIAVVQRAGRQSDSEVEANARLIAAAPELLYALKAILAEDRLRPIDPLNPKHDDTWQLVHAAINKAEGL